MAVSSECGSVNKLNRESQSVFICKDCGNSGNADYIASLNIMYRGTHGKCLPANRHQSVEQEALALQGGECVTQAIDKLMEGKNIEPHKLIIKDKNELC